MSLYTRNNSVTKRQLVAMLDYFEIHEGMFSGKITPNFTKEIKNSLWEDLTEKLNAQHSEDVGERKGSIKSVAKWQRSWIDWKCAVKRKFRDNLFKRGTIRLLNDLEFRALKMMERLETKKKTSGDLDDDNAEANIKEGSSSREHSLSLTIEDVRSNEEEPSTPVEEHSSPISFETIRVKEEPSTSLASDSDTEIAESSTLIIKDTPVSSMKETSQRNIIAIASRASPRVVLRDIAPKKTPSNTQTSTQNKSSSGTTFVPSVGMQQIVTVSPDITNDSLTHGMENISSSGTGSVISAETDSFAAGLLGMQPNVSKALGNINPYAINKKLLLGLNPTKPIILNPTPPVVMAPVVSTNSSSATRNSASFSSIKDSAASQQNADAKRQCLSVPAIRSKKNIWKVIDRRRAALTQKIKTASQASTSSTSDNPREETEESNSKREEIPEVICDKDSTTKQSPEDTLGGLPLNLQNSILERLDTLNRNIETNTCALTILSKAINDSADSQMRVINNLSKILTTVGNTILASVDRLMGPPDQE